MIYVVLGMHKSGTTLVSEILHQSGIRMGEAFDPSVEYDQGNQYERTETAEINKKILGWNLPSQEFVPRESYNVDEGSHARMRQVVSACEARGGDWGFKDPRTCLTYEFWAEVLPPHRIIAIHRDLREVWAHYNVPGVRKTPTRQVLRAWALYNERILEIVSARPGDSLVLAYGELMQDRAEFRRLERFVGLPLQDTRQPSRYRNKPRSSIRLQTTLLWLRSEARRIASIRRGLEALREEQIAAGR